MSTVSKDAELIVDVLTDAVLEELEPLADDAEDIDDMDEEPDVSDTAGGTDD